MKKLAQIVMRVMLSACMIICMTAGAMAATNDGSNYKKAIPYTSGEQTISVDTNYVYVAYTPAETGVYEVSIGSGVDNFEIAENNTYGILIKELNGEAGTALVKATAGKKYVFHLYSDSEDISTTFNIEKATNYNKYTTPETAYEWDGKEETNIEYHKVDDDLFYLDDDVASDEDATVYIKLNVKANQQYILSFDNKDGYYDDKEIWADAYMEGMEPEDGYYAFNVVKDDETGEIIEQNTIVTPEEDGTLCIEVNPTASCDIRILNHNHDGLDVFYGYNDTWECNVAYVKCDRCDGCDGILHWVGTYCDGRTYNGKSEQPEIYEDGFPDMESGDPATAEYGVDFIADPDPRTVSYKDIGNYTFTIKYMGLLKDCHDEEVTYTIRPKGTSVSKLTAAAKAFTVKWTSQTAKMPTSRVTGYQIQYDTDKYMDYSDTAKTVTVKGYKSTSKKISKLKAKKKYYVRVRTYMKTSTGTVYSNWSSIKSVKTK